MRTILCILKHIFLVYPLSPVPEGPRRSRSESNIKIHFTPFTGSDPEWRERGDDLAGSMKYMHYHKTIPRCLLFGLKMRPHTHRALNGGSCERGKSGRLAKSSWIVLPCASGCPKIHRNRHHSFRLGWIYEFQSRETKRFPSNPR